MSLSFTSTFNANNWSGSPTDGARPTVIANPVLPKDQRDFYHAFNTAAFSIPPPGTFGNAGRNTIVGPGSSNVSLALLRSVTLGRTRSLSFQIQANNIFNTVQFATIDTVVNSPTFGEVTATRPMRRVQLVIRLRF